MRLSVLPARDGDCLILSYGSEPRRHVVIDGGRGADANACLRERLKAFAAAGEILELLVVSHFDADHIEGTLSLVCETPPLLAPREVWFNGFDQVRGLIGPDVQAMNEGHADDLSLRLAELRWPVNKAFDGAAACLPSNGPPVVKRLEGGLELILLSPDRPRLERLGRRWERWRLANREDDEVYDPDVQVMGKRRRAVPADLDVEALARSGSKVDDEVPNGSSIALLARFGSRSVLLAADAHPNLLERNIRALLPDGTLRLPVDLVKVGHHGSGRNTTSGLVDVLDARRFVISTDGSRHQHPDPEAIARLLVHSPAGERTLYFNYAQEWTTLWDKPDLRSRYGYVCEFPGEDGCLAVDV